MYQDKPLTKNEYKKILEHANETMKQAKRGDSVLARLRIDFARVILEQWKRVNELEGEIAYLQKLIEVNERELNEV